MIYRMIYRVRGTMQALGYRVVPRPAPVVVVDPSLPRETGKYNAVDHAVRVAPGYSLRLLGHELAHSQQPRHAVMYYRDGVADRAAWLRDPYEQEAEAVGLALELGLDAAPDVLAVIAKCAEASHVPAYRWVEWVGEARKFGTVLGVAKPGHLPRKLRMALNAAAAHFIIK